MYSGRLPRVIRGKTFSPFSVEAEGGQRGQLLLGVMVQATSNSDGTVAGVCGPRKTSVGKVGCIPTA